MNEEIKQYLETKFRELEAKILIQDGLVRVNGEIDVRRGRKLYPGDVFELEGNEVKVVAL